MKRKILSLLMTFCMVFSLTSCGSGGKIVDMVTNDTGEKTEVSQNSDTAKKAADTNKAGMKTISKDELKIGVLYIGSASETSGYTYAHEIGIQGMANNIGLSDNQIVRKESVSDSDEKAIKAALQDCVDKKCNVIFTTSWGYMNQTEEFAEKYPDIYFANATGYLSNGKNFTNYFGRIYQTRYLSGIVAGLKTKTNKIGYVSAMGTDNSECTGGVDAFAIGVESVNKAAKVKVAVTNSWYAPDDEKKASDALIAAGCDVLAQHCDTTAPQEASQDNGTWSIGYNSDMSKETPKATLTSVIWNWSAYYTSYISSIINASYDGKNYYGGMKENLVSLTELSSLCESDTADKIKEAKENIISGKFGVFDGVLKTNTGKTVGKEGKTLDDATITGKINWYYHNVSLINWK
ncbi:BMP family ABC transporter substrate-binding protein [Clostridium sp. AF34-13]|uniref:BMP family ABC transporter substrate-binding protein n=1 Tax=Clostridium sp. AF34-13 TaxID=2293012 RepID=UPI000E4D4147|nr:BMP family ABC transporter substrate-binding protein [Clostridium sp. AF34-13]RHP27006.1 BMP family ABC transporter substrate-binding protein [Clostridium sp. AF34-13]